MRNTPSWDVVGAGLVRPGQACNSAVNLAAPGAASLAVGAVGIDTEGKALLEALGERGADASGILAASTYKGAIGLRVRHEVGEKL